MDIGRELKAAIGLAPGDHGAGTREGAAIDTKGFHEALVVLNADEGGEGSTLDVKVQESADGSTGWADITGAAFAQVLEDNCQAVYQGRVRITASRKRYVRIVGVIATAAFVFGVVVLLGEATSVPAGADNHFDIHG